MTNFSVSNIIKEKISGIKFGLLYAENVQVKKNDPNFEMVFLDLENELKNKFANRPPSDDEIIGHVRRMYRRIGWEPTRYRPSSEALVRRIIKGKGLYRINNLVDYGNVVSAKYHLSMGLYDLDKINGDVIFDVGRVNESYQGISKELIHAEGKLILRDETGIFGNPTADSHRTSITENTNSVLAVFFCPPEVKNDYMNAVLNTLQGYYKESCLEAIIKNEVFEP